jgi:hypothetical protein
MNPSTVTGDGNLIFGQPGSPNANYELHGVVMVGGDLSIVTGQINLFQVVLSGTATMTGGNLNGVGELIVTGAMTWNGGTMTGTGRTRVAGGLSFGAATSVARVLSGRTLETSGPGTWTGTGGLTLANGASWYLLEGGILDFQTNTGISVSGSGGTIYNAGVLRKSVSPNMVTIQAGFINTGLVDVRIGTLFLAGPFPNFSPKSSTLSGGTYQIAGTFQFINANVGINDATIVLEGPASRITNQTGVDALTSLASNTAAGIFTLQNGQNVTTTMSFTNAGGVVLTGNSSFTISGNYSQVAGFTTIGVGTLAASLVDLEAGILSGSGTIEGDVLNAGQIDVGGAGAAGLLIITGNFTQTATGILNLEIGGLMPGDQFNQLQIGGLATLDGTLNIALLDEYFPMIDDSFQVLTFGSRNGDFAVMNGLDLGGGLFFDPVYGDNGLDLVTRAGS